MVDPVQADQLDLDAGLLQRLASRGLLERLARVEVAGGQVPCPETGFDRSTQEQDRYLRRVIGLALDEDGGSWLRIGVPPPGASVTDERLLIGPGAMWADGNRAAHAAQGISQVDYLEFRPGRSAQPLRLRVREVFTSRGQHEHVDAVAQTIPSLPEGVQAHCLIAHDP